MTNRIDPLGDWTRKLARLRREAARRNGAAPREDLTEDLLEMCEALLRDLAGARLEQDWLRAEGRSLADEREHLFEMMPAACVVTDSAGRIVKANRAAAAILNLSARALKDRELLLFAEYRQDFDALLQRLDPGSDDLRATVTFRPRERKPLALDVVVLPFAAGRSEKWLWFLTPVTRMHDTARTQIPA